MKIIADKDIPFLKGVLEPYAEIEYYSGSQITNEVVMDADALITRTRTKCNSELLHNSNIKFISSATIGFDHIDTDYCKKNKIEWTNAPGCNSSSVQQYVAAALIHISRKYNFSLGNRTLGVVGVGHVGSKIVKLAEYLGMTVLLNDPPRVRNEGLCGFVSLDGILRDCDIITFHVPLNMSGEDKTYHMINKNLLDKVNPGTFIINTSRGEVADTGDLKNSLSSGKIAGAIIDVWEGEPDIDVDLLDLVDIGTPHIAGYSADGKANGTAMSVRALSKYFNIGIDNWKPVNIPVPDNTEININNSSEPGENIIAEAVINTHNISKDDIRLRQSPGTFEKQRAEYPLRREFDSYTVRLARKDRNVVRILRRMGFNVEIN
ncbi:MAG: 4-phosphoerythronate dehydrogenase PdxB [Bacteroidales bacterium]|nr:MAG: 4-phosphoerythronate dehydrogenase PdxB [Bacteroidales bacterium]